MEDRRAAVPILREAIFEIKCKKKIGEEGGDMDTKPGEKKKEEGKDWEKLFCGPAIFSVFSICPYYSRYGHSPTRDAVEGNLTT
jgi:hypothetical protein